MAENTGWRRRTGVIKTLPWQKLGPYYPSEIADGGEDIPLDRRGRFVWFLIVAAVLVVGAVLVILSR